MAGLWGFFLDTVLRTGPAQSAERSAVLAEADEAAVPEVLCLLRRGPHVDAWGADLSGVCRGLPYACGSEGDIDVTPPEDPPPGQDLDPSP